MEHHLPSNIRYGADGRRQGKLLTLMGTSWKGEVYLSDIYISAGTFLAFKHLQERNGAVVPELPALMEGCDFDFTYEQRETEYEANKAIQELVDATTNNSREFEMPQNQAATLTSDEPSVADIDVDMIWEDENSVHSDPSSQNETTSSLVSSKREAIDGTTLVTLPEHRQLAHDHEDAVDQDWQQPFAMTGSSYSVVTLPLSIVGGGMELPMLSGSATSTQLDSQPFFGRTIPTNSGDARAALLYYQSIGVKHVAVLYIADPYGNSYHTDFQQHARDFPDLKVSSYPYQLYQEEVALRQIKESGYRYIFAIVYDWKLAFEAAWDLGVLANNNYSWITAEHVEWTGPGFDFNRTDYEFEIDPDDDPASIPSEYKWKHAFNGMGQLTLHVPEHERFQVALEELALNETLRNDYLNHFHEPEIWQGLDWSPPGFSFYANMNYDAMIALGLAACQTPGLFTGAELYETLKTVEFQGTTGSVCFDSLYLNRDVDSVQYRIDSIYLSDERSDEEVIRFESHMAAIVANGKVEHLQPFRYHDNTTTRPLEIPPVQDYDYNLVPTWAHILGLCLMGVVVVMSLGWVAWTYYHRKLSVIKASQPIFLLQLCAGTLVMSSAVIPMSFQGTEESLGLDIACMSIPWLVFTGFVTALAALFSKAWRLNRIMRSGQRLRRIQVDPIDVIWPFALLMSFNVAMLLAWTFFSPWKYVRESKENNVDSFGRSVESFGSCQSDDGHLSLVFLIPIAVADFAGLVFATYQSYKGRNLPTAFSESSYLALSMASLLESLLLGGPILFVVLQDPTALYLVGSALLCISCLTILLPVFLPKYWSQRSAGVSTGSLTTSVNLRPGVTAQFNGSLVSNNGNGSQISNNLRISGISEDEVASGDDRSAMGSGTFSVGSSTTWGKMNITRVGLTDGGSASSFRVPNTRAPSRINRSRISRGSTTRNDTTGSRQSDGSDAFATDTSASFRRKGTNETGASVRFAPSTKE